ncbi:MAG TPA: hypothetical protein VGD47_10820 [Steroidobacteraceae bacterium]
MSTGLPYLRARRRRLAWLLLPALLLRALIPFGFMPVVAGGGMAIGFCPGEAALPPGIAAAHQFQAHHSGGADPGAPGTTAHNAPCLFAASAAAAFAPAVLGHAVSAAGVAPHDKPAATTVFLPTILRAQSPRGPPLLA